MKEKYVQVSKGRIDRPKNIAMTAMPIRKENSKDECISVIFHRSLKGSVMLALNKVNQIIRCWSDVDGVLPIKAKYIPTERFGKQLSSLKPKVLHLNDGSLLQPFPRDMMISLYEGKTLNCLLEELQKNTSFVKPTRDESDSTCISFEDMKIMDPTMTQDEYVVFSREWSRRGH